jgi:ABC-2 type transport system permease protein
MSALQTAEAGPGAVLARTAAAEWTRLRTVRTTWWCLLAAAVVVIGLGTTAAVEEGGEPGVTDIPAWLAGQLGILPGQYALLTLVLLAVTAEYATGMIGPTLQWTPRRGALLVARFGVPVLVATVAGVAMALVTDVLVWLLVPEMAMTASDLASSLGRIGLVLAAGGILAVGAGLLLRSTAGALSTVFALLLLLPLLLPVFGNAWLTDLAELLPGSGALALLDAGPDMTTGAAVTLMGLWAAGALAVGGWSLLRRDAG